MFFVSSVAILYSHFMASPPIGDSYHAGGLVWYRGEMAWEVFIGPISRIGTSLWEMRRFGMPSVIFGQPEPTDDGPQRWWHVPIYINKPTFFMQPEKHVAIQIPAAFSVKWSVSFSPA